MKKFIFNFVFIFVLAIPSSGFAFEYLWTDDYGSRVFDCGGLHVGGKALVKERGHGVYRVKGVLIDREIRANSIFHAAKIACGEAKEEMPVEQQPAKQTPPE